MKWITFLFLIIFNTPRTSFAQWIGQLPTAVIDSIYWSADHEEGTLNDWTLPQFLYPGGGIFNTGGTDVLAFVDSSHTHSGNYSAGATITNAWQAQNGKKAVRLMRWTDTAWDNGGDYFPAPSYYSCFYFFPSTFNPNKYQPWDPGDGGWWNIFQFKSRDENDESQPVWTLNVDHDDANQEMSLYLYTKENIPNSNGQNNPIPIPVGKWVHLEAFYLASDPNTNNGHIIIWQNGEKIMDIPNVVTTLEQGEVTWGIGNYTDHIDGGDTLGEATLYFDDAIVSTLPIHPYASCQDFETNTWTGNGNGIHWHDPLNWSERFVPLRCQQVIIPSGFQVIVAPSKIIDVLAIEVQSGALLSVDTTSAIKLWGAE